MKTTCLIFKVAGLAIAFWIGVHFFSLLGWLVAALYFIFQLWQTKKPKPLRRLWRETALLGLIFLISLAYVWLESSFLKDLGYPRLSQTAQFVLSSQKEYRLGEVFPLEIKVAHLEVPINVVRADLSFDPEQLEVIDFSTENSLAQVFVQKEINNQSGYARLAGGLPNPGFTGQEGKFATVYFRTRKPGLAVIEFLSSSLILANDGRGTNILKESPKINCLILPEIAPDQNLVLGEATKGAQLILYPEERVERKTNFIPEKSDRSFLEYLAQFDIFVINFWKAVAARFI